MSKKLCFADNEREGEMKTGAVLQMGLGGRPLFFNLFYYCFLNMLHFKEFFRHTPQHVGS